MDEITQTPPWTRHRVETRLIAAFRAMPSCPVYGIGARIRTAERGETPLTEVLNWATFLDADPAARKYLWAWARCRATGNAFVELCRAHAWKQTTAEVGRRRGADTIAARLNATSGPP